MCTDHMELRISEETLHNLKQVVLMAERVPAYPQNHPAVVRGNVEALRDVKAMIQSFETQRTALKN